ncbi:CoA-binding protein [Halosolutus gelatinilyticus]|uniref:CoA-binding protein n=1 Tax=Halosolutus gelatinilyticus TaxID=2931975 RepID=UPI001FF4F700|nr:CoA-binding protein [Halosolutus gelatinilyticus]
MCLSDLFDPDGIAVVGASATPGKLGNDAMSNVEAYDGEVYPVNPLGSGTVYDYEFIESIAETDADLALCCVPRHVQPQVLEECGEAGVGAAVIFAGGFAETDGEGQELQDEIAAIADEYKITVLGPNTAGYAIPQDDLYGSFIPRIHEVGSGNVGIAAQSAGVAITLSFHLTREGYGVSAMFGLGNRVHTEFADVIPALDEDPRTEAIVLHVEGTVVVETLLAVCREAETPIVAYTVGEHDVADAPALDGPNVDAVARDENVDVVLVYEIYDDSLGYPVDELEALSADLDKPILLTVAGPHEALREERERMEAFGIPTFDTPERGARAVAALIRSISGGE